MAEKIRAILYVIWARRITPLIACRTLLPNLGTIAAARGFRCRIPAVPRIRRC
jgi:hypothetical protein